MQITTTYARQRTKPTSGWQSAETVLFKNPTPNTPSSELAQMMDRWERSLVSNFPQQEGHSVWVKGWNLDGSAGLVGFYVDTPPWRLVKVLSSAYLDAVGSRARRQEVGHGGQGWRLSDEDGGPVPGDDFSHKYSRPTQGTLIARRQRELRRLYVDPDDPTEAGAQEPPLMSEIQAGYELAVATYGRSSSPIGLTPRPRDGRSHPRGGPAWIIGGFDESKRFRRHVEREVIAGNIDDFQPPNSGDALAHIDDRAAGDPYATEMLTDEGLDVVLASASGDGTADIERRARMRLVVEGLLNTGPKREWWRLMVEEELTPAVAAVKVGMSKTTGDTWFHRLREQAPRRL